MVTISDRILLLNLKNYYYKRFKSIPSLTAFPLFYLCLYLFYQLDALLSPQQSCMRLYNRQYLKAMSRQLTNLRESKLHPVNLRDFTNSVDIKRFSRQRGNMTPMHHHTNNYFKKIYQRSNEKIRNTQPASLGISFSKNISQKNMETKRKLSSGFPVAKSNHFSVSIDQHLLKEKYNLIKEMFESQKYEKIVPLIRHIVHHFQYSNAQKNLYYWLTVALLHQHKYEEAVEEITECLTAYSNFQEGYLCLACIYLKMKRYKHAVDNYEIAIKTNPKIPAPYIQLAYCYQTMKDYNKAISFSKDSLSKFPKEAEHLMIFVQCSLALNHKEECEIMLNKIQDNYNRKDSLILYIKGLIQKSNQNENQAYILFEESLKYNNNRIGVNKSLLQTIKIEINIRDFYKAHHSVSRIKFLELQETEQMRIYSIFIEGVMTMMKKKSEESVEILSKINGNKKCDEMNLTPLINKYFGYGHFKLSEYAKSINYYQRIKNSDLDESSSYNKLLVEGIELADRQKCYADAIGKFNQAKTVYPQKVEPYIYIAMTIILKRINSADRDESKLAQSLIQALKELELGYRLNPNSSNLLYHRTIIHLYFQDWEEAHNDINRCIQKAEENLPKYFYLRGVCHTCVRDFKKAINQFSICLSLDVKYSEAHLQKAKCYFLLGNTEKGFSSLKQFMELNPNDLSIYKWIGDLLYEGMSYNDALKAYNELGTIEDLETHIMKLKCMFRMGSMNEITAQLKLLEKHSGISREKIALDINAINLLTLLLKQQNKNMNTLIKKINKSLESNIVGYLFQLIDCMNLMGIASFYCEKYSDAYESFLLVLELFQSLQEKQTFSLKSQCSDQDKNLKAQDIYSNIIICQFAQGSYDEAIRMISEEYLGIITNTKRKKAIETMLKGLDSNDLSVFDWDTKNDKPFNNKSRKVELQHGNLNLKAKPVFNLYHDSAVHLYSSTVAEKMVNKLHAGYIDNMPQGPWIKRNPYGVIFTDEVMPTDNSISFEDTPRLPSHQSNPSEQDEERFSQEQAKKTISKREEFLKKLKFDEAVEAKLNNMIQKAQVSKKSN